MTEKSLDRGSLKGTEALDLYLTELTSKVLLMSQQSALLVQALNEQDVILAHMAGQAEESRR